MASLLFKGRGVRSVSRTITTASQLHLIPATDTAYRRRGISAQALPTGPSQRNTTTAEATAATARANWASLAKGRRAAHVTTPSSAPEEIGEAEPSVHPTDKDGKAYKYPLDEGKLSFTKNALYKITIPLDPPGEVVDTHRSAPAPPLARGPQFPPQPVKVKNVYHLHQHHHHHHPDSEDVSPQPSSHAPDENKVDQGKVTRKDLDQYMEDLVTRKATSSSESKTSNEESTPPPAAALPFGLSSDGNWESINKSHSEAHRINELLKLGEERALRGPEVEGSSEESDPSSGVSPQDQAPVEKRQDNLQRLPHEPAAYVVLLLHETQPLSYVANLIRAEHPSDVPSEHQRIVEQESKERHRSHESEAHLRQVEERKNRDATRSWALLGGPPVSFFTRASAGRRWSPATTVGEFLRDAARVGSFVIRIGERSIQIKVPTFEDRTRHMRAELYTKTEQIQKMTNIKDTCDAIAYRDARRLSWSGMGVLASWWVSVSYLTFCTSAGWDLMEPITYLTGLASVMAGYGWVLHHNREVSYRAVVNATLTRRQQRLYLHHGLDMDQFQELIQQVKILRQTIQLIASEYDLEWKQEETRAAQTTVEALRIVRSTELRDRANAARAEEAATALAAHTSSSKSEDDSQEDEASTGGRQGKPQKDSSLAV